MVEYYPRSYQHRHSQIGMSRALIKVELWGRMVVCAIGLRFSIEEQLLRRNVKRFRRGLVSQAQTRVYYSSLGFRVMKKNKRMKVWGSGVRGSKVSPPVHVAGP